MNKSSLGDDQLVFHYSMEDPVRERTGVHVWLLNLDKPVSNQSLLAALSLGEWSRADTLKDSLQRDRFLARCLHLRNILSSLTGLPPATFEFGKNSCGKPRLKGFSEYPSYSTTGLSFSISHTEEALAVAVAFGHEVGVDLEKMNHEFDPGLVAEASFVKKDVEKLRSLPEEERSLAFYRLWTQREAIGKMEGNGILPSRNEQRRVNGSIHIHSFEYTHSAQKILGTVAVGELQSLS